MLYKNLTNQKDDGQYKVITPDGTYLDPAVVNRLLAMQRLMGISHWVYTVRLRLTRVR